MLIADNWLKEDYQLIDTGNGEKLERWGGYLFIRPDPQIIWPVKSPALWSTAHMHYHRNKNSSRSTSSLIHETHGYWETKQSPPKSWDIHYLPKELKQSNKLRFRIRPTDFKHMGLFPEQAVNWEWMISKITHAAKPITVLNLFAYTGGASCACAAAGATVCHVDAAKGMNNWAKENAELSGIGNRIRFITDDVMKFVQREKRRNHSYDAIIMDPPSYGRGPSGEIWKIEDKLYDLVSVCAGLLSARPLFFLINSYTTGFSPTVAVNILQSAIKNAPGKMSGGEIGLRAHESGLTLPCGIYGRWEI